MPDEPEALGLLALLLLTDARRPARTAPDGSLVRLPDQDRSRWDRPLIAEGHDLVRTCLRINRPGTYQLQAAILATHAIAPTWSATSWATIVSLYDELHRIEPTPVVALNRALAVAERDGPAEALAAIEPLAERLDRYHLYHAARAELLRRLGRHDESRAANGRALSLTDNPAERQLLEARLRG
jgi:RNA polymerase sigma-70 factor (ECF subfamily)